MIRRLFVCSMVLLCLLLLCIGSVRAQCTGQYANDPTYQMLIPKDYAAQGNVAITTTVYASNVSGSVHSGVAKYTPGVWVGIDVTAWNAQSRSWYYLVNSDPTHYGAGSGPVGNNPETDKNPQAWLTDASQVGSTITYVNTAYSGPNETGVSTQDRITFTVVAGNGPSIVFEDGLDTNFYWQTITTGGGSSMLTSCQECQAGTTQHCINATHTPYSTIQLTNDMSGESQLIQGVQSGNVARSNESLSFSASLAISVRPGDTGTISIDHKIICSMDGVIFEQTLPKPKTSPSGGSWNPSMTGELAFTKMSLKVPTHCTPKLDASGKTIGLMCDVAYYCTARSSPPDYQPTKLVTYYYTDPASVPTYWMTMSPGTALVFGKNQPGEIAVWYFPLSTVQQVLTGMGLPDPLLLDIFSLAWVSDSSEQDCTKWISGITPWYMPKW